MATRPLHVLFACVGNSGRSIMAESLLESLGGARFRASSAGPQPSDRVDPWAVEALATHGYRAGGFRPKSWDEFAAADAAPVDVVITLCPRAARIPTPDFPGKPVRAFWIVEDPSQAEGTDEEKRCAYARVLADIRRRVQHLTFLPFESAPPRALAVPLAEIGVL